MSTHIQLPDGLPDFGQMAAGKAAAGTSTTVQRGHFNNLNPQQLAIVAAPVRGVVQCIAGAGCGKTTGALLPRAQKLYEVNPGIIAILAFNVSVKEELESKIEKMMDPAAATKTKPYTIAGLARRLVMNNLDLLGLPKGSELITADWIVIKFLKEHVEAQTALPIARRVQHFDPVFNTFTDAHMRALFEAEEKATAQGQPIENVAKGFEKLANLDPQVIKSWVFWNRGIRLASGKLMWRDLLPLAAMLPAECYENLGFKHVLIDEAQDLSVEQHAMIRKLADAVESLTFVGDPSQCIYKWNGARPDLFMSIPKNYPGTQVYYLETNYRSDQPVLDLANYVLGHLNSPIRLKTPFPRNGEPIRTVKADNADLVASVQELLENGVDAEQIAILARVNAHMLDLEVSFANAGIPYQCWGGSFFESPVVNDVLAYYRVLFPGAHGVTEEDWQVVVGHTKFLGNKTIEETWDRSPTDPLADTRVPSACRSANQRGLWNEFVQFMDRLKRIFGSSPANMWYEVARRMEPIWEDRYADDPSKFRESREIALALGQWITNHATMDDLFAGMTQLSRKGSTGVVLSTVHKAKGLEWDFVYLWKVGKGFPMAWERADQEEEACIFYVAATRARHFLTLCYDQYAQQVPYGLDRALCPANYVVTEAIAVPNSGSPGSSDSTTPQWGMYNVCNRCPRQLECLVSSQGPL